MYLELKYFIITSVAMAFPIYYFIIIPIISRLEIKRQENLIWHRNGIERGSVKWKE